MAPFLSPPWCRTNILHGGSGDTFPAWSSQANPGSSQWRQRDQVWAITPLKQEGQKQPEAPFHNTSVTVIPCHNWRVRKHGVAGHPYTDWAFPGQAQSTGYFLLKFCSVFKRELNTAEVKQLKAFAVFCEEVWASPALCRHSTCIFSWFCNKGACGETFMKTKSLWKLDCDPKRGIIYHENQ